MMRSQTTFSIDLETILSAVVLLEVSYPLATAWPQRISERIFLHCLYPVAYGTAQFSFATCLGSGLGVICIF